MNGTIEIRRNISGDIDINNYLSASVTSIGNINALEEPDTRANGSVSRPSTLYVKEVEFGNYLEFPSIGEENVLYVAKDDMSCYIFDIDTLTYRCIGRDYNEIETIQGTL